MNILSSNCLSVTCNYVDEQQRWKYGKGFENTLVVESNLQQVLVWKNETYETTIFFYSILIEHSFSRKCMCLKSNFFLAKRWMLLCKMNASPWIISINFKCSKGSLENIIPLKSASPAVLHVTITYRIRTTYTENTNWDLGRSLFVCIVAVAAIYTSI